MDQKKFNLTFLDKEYTCLYIKEHSVALEAFKDLLESNQSFGLDIETMGHPEFQHLKHAGLDPHLGKARLIQVYDVETELTYVFDMLTIKFDEELLELFYQFFESKVFVAHNGIFELQFFKQMGVRNMKINCSQIAATLVYHAIYPNDAGSQVGLAAVVKALFKIDLQKESQASDWKEPNLIFEQIKYAALDAIVCVLVMDKFTVALKKYGMERVYKLARDVQHPLATMQIRGIGFDVETHANLINEWRTELHAQRRKVLDITGLQELTSPKISQWLEDNLTDNVKNNWTKTPSAKNPKLSVDKGTLSEYSHLPLVAPFALYKAKETLISTFGQSLADKVNIKTGNIHGRFKIQGARTGRFSSYEPNMQNAPHDQYFRNLFKAAPGNLLVCADYSQVELRMAAELSQDADMLAAYEQGIDLHTLTASKTSGVSIKDVTKPMRQLAKALNFGLLYGIGAAKFSAYAKQSYGADITDEDALEAIAIFKKSYPGYTKWQREQAQNGEASLTTYTPCGKRRRLDKDKSYGASMNTPIQGGSAEVTSYAAIRLEKYFNENDINAWLVLMVHDELLVECEESIAPEVDKIMHNEMLKAYLDVLPYATTTRNLVESGIAECWGDAK